MSIDKDRRLVDLTVGELLDLLNQTEKPKIIDTTDRPYAFGINEIAKFFGKSKATIGKYISAGYFDNFKEAGNRIVISHDDLKIIARENNLKINNPV